MNESCATCKFYKEPSSEKMKKWDIGGLCRRYAPGNAETRSGNWCGDYVEKEADSIIADVRGAERETGERAEKNVHQRVMNIGKPVLYIGNPKTLIVRFIGFKNTIGRWSF